MYSHAKLHMTTHKSYCFRQTQHVTMHNAHYFHNMH